MVRGFPQPGPSAGTISGWAHVSSTAGFGTFGRSRCTQTDQGCCEQESSEQRHLHLLFRFCRHRAIACCQPARSTTAVTTARAIPPQKQIAPPNACPPATKPGPVVATPMLNAYAAAGPGARSRHRATAKAPRHAAAWIMATNSTSRASAGSAGMALIGTKKDVPTPVLTAAAKRTCRRRSAITDVPSPQRHHRTWQVWHQYSVRPATASDTIGVSQIRQGLPVRYAT